MTMTQSQAYHSQPTSPYAMHRRWIEQDTDLQDADVMRAYDLAAYYAEQDGCHTGTDNDA